MARQLAAAEGTPPKPPSKSPKGISLSEALDLQPDEMVTEALKKQAANQASTSEPSATLFGIPILTPSSYKVQETLEAYKQGIISKHQVESIIGLPISD